jgi:alkanesulfonate monooxygenase SsuD/methylene tetrahydromethanopterin reductase-like flavin-dependent oxidoreductase (luciferase family)
MRSLLGPTRKDRASQAQSGAPGASVLECFTTLAALVPVTSRLPSRLNSKVTI